MLTWLVHYPLGQGLSQGICSPDWCKGSRAGGACVLTLRPGILGNGQFQEI